MFCCMLLLPILQNRTLIHPEVVVALAAHAALRIGVDVRDLDAHLAVGAGPLLHPKRDAAVLGRVVLLLRIHPVETQSGILGASGFSDLA